jgi:hypothetical protein
MIHKESQKDGLKVKNLRVSSIRTEAFKIEEEAIERVDDFLYLGSKIDLKKTLGRSAKKK